MSVGLNALWYDIVQQSTTHVEKHESDREVCKVSVQESFEAFGLPFHVSKLGPKDLPVPYYHVILVLAGGPGVKS